jgi:phosphate transport system permease protein
MTAYTFTPGPAATVQDEPRELVETVGFTDRIFRGIARGSGFAVLLIMSMVGIFLAARAWEALSESGTSFLTTQQWEPDARNFGIAAIIVGTILIALVAIVIAVPLATAVALYISEYAPQRIKQTLISLVDLMAAVPSIVYGLWGFFFLQYQITGVSRWISTYFGWVPFLDVKGADPRDPLSPQTVYTSSTFICGIVVALMVAPIICSIMREVFSQAPAGEREGALALGATKWGMIRAVVLPYGKGGMIGGSMLGLGRALGETIAIYVIISPVFAIQPNILENGGSSVASLIALRYGASSDFAISALFAAGLTLFCMTLVVNFIASTVISRSRSGAESDA